VEKASQRKKRGDNRITYHNKGGGDATPQPKDREMSYQRSDEQLHLFFAGGKKKERMPGFQHVEK